MYVYLIFSSSKGSAMDIIRKITELSFQLDFVKEFSEFVDIVHTEFKCSNSEFTLGIFNNKLKIQLTKTLAVVKVHIFLWKYAFDLSMYFHRCIAI